MIGLASAILFGAGYLADIPGMMGIAPLVGLIGAIPALRSVLQPARTSDMVQPPPLPAPERMPADTFPAPGAAFSSRAHGFEGLWFVMHLTPTYDDTNSVGNVYFANYFRWVGKARELMFNACLPGFDLQTTEFYILTKSFNHEFRRELREFQKASVRLKILSYNRKFATLAHEVHCEAGLVGRGQQTLMFVDSGTYRPLDIPPSVLKGFLPFYAPN